jgi:hypothetical protein
MMIPTLSNNDERQRTFWGERWIQAGEAGRDEQRKAPL